MSDLLSSMKKMFEDMDWEDFVGFWISTGFILLLFIGPFAVYFYDKKQCDLHGRFYKIESLYSNQLKTKNTMKTGIGLAYNSGGVTVNRYVYELDTGDLFVAESPYRIGSQVKLFHKNQQGLFYQRGFTKVR